MTNETKQTAMEIMLDEMMAHEYTIPLELIVKCKELIEIEKEQIIDALLFGDVLSLKTAENYYNETYGGNK
jgi:hypothetical protein